jgi:uncharacterized protein
MIRHYAKLLRATPMASLMLVAMSGAAVAGPFEDGIAAYQRGDYATAYRLWRPLADQGNADAQDNLGKMYAEGQGVPQDYAEAVKWYRLAADQGNAQAQTNLGVMYYEGQGVPQDYAEAAKWYRLAADQDNADGQYNLGIMYAKGRTGGLPPDFVKAHMWLNLAASRYLAWEKELRDDAIKSRDFVASRMTPAQIAEAQKLAREWKPKLER